MNAVIRTTVFAILMVGLGLAAGWYAAEQTHVDAPADDAAADDAAEMEFDIQTLANLGVRLGKVEPSTPRRIERIQAVVRHTPESPYVVSSPFSGRVAALDTPVGSIVGSNDTVVTVLRDRLPPFEPKRAAPLLQPVNEELHEAYANLMQSAKKKQILQEELGRLENLDEKTGDDLPLVSRQKIIDLQYDLRRASTEVDAWTHKLEAHGVAASQIDNIVAGGHPPHGKSLWQRALAHHGLWPKQADEVRELLPSNVRDQPRTIAAIGELSANGMLDARLVDTVGKTATIRNNFLDFVRLRLDGYSLFKLRSIAKRGGLDHPMKLRAGTTDDAASDSWDVEAFHVAPGEQVRAGQHLVTLRDASRMHLVLYPVGDEVAALRIAAQKRDVFRASPLVAGTGPDLEGLQLAKLDSETHAKTGESHVRAFAECKNEALVSDESRVRTWSLLPGTRYVASVSVPRSGSPLIPVPTGGILRRGSEAFVFVLEHGHMHEHQVRIVEMDEDFAYVAPGGFDTKERIVIKGALALSLALQRDGADAGAHHGHSH